MAEPEAEIFTDIPVGPTESIVGRMAGDDYRGGPLWPDFTAQIAPRHCRRVEPEPFDAPPGLATAPEDQLDEAVWCGPVCFHFGHAIADFGMRILRSAVERPGLKLLFAHWPGGATQIPPFFTPMLAQFGVDPARALVVDRPMRVGRLHVFPQAERLHGPLPDPGYLDLLDRHTPGERDPLYAGRTVFVSRSRIRADNLIGRIAGEAYLDEVMRRSGVIVMHPESLPLPAQLRIYRSAARLIFSEGSAVHALQLLGRLEAEVTVINRRQRQRMAGNALKGRAPAVHWVDVGRGLVRGRRQNGTGFDVSRGVMVLDGAALCARLEQACGLDLRPQWDEAAWMATIQADVAKWVRGRGFYIARRNYPADDAAVVAESVAALGLTL
jgi:hypothetical protein